MTGEEADAVLPGLPHQVAGQGGLADPGLAAEQHQPAPPVDGSGQLLAQEDLLPHPADQDRRRFLEAGARLAGETVHGYGRPRGSSPPSGGRRGRVI